MDQAVTGASPYDTPVDTGGKYRYVRLGNGKLTEWDKKEQKEIDHESVIGSLERISYYYDEMSAAKGFPADMVEIALRHRDDTLQLVQWRQASTVCTMSVARTIGQVAKGQVVALTAWGGDKKTTFANLHTWDGMNWKRLEGPKVADLDAALDELKKHPAFADRPQRRTAEDGNPDYTTPQDDFFAAALAAGWPAPKGIEGAYCEVFTKALKRTVNTFAQLTDDDWKTLESGISSAKSVPKALTAAVPKDGEYDPFAD